MAPRRSLILLASASLFSCSPIIRTLVCPHFVRLSLSLSLFLSRSTSFSVLSSVASPFSPSQTRDNPQWEPPAPLLSTAPRVVISLWLHRSPSSPYFSSGETGTTLAGSLPAWPIYRGKLGKKTVCGGEQNGRDNEDVAATRGGSRPTCEVAVVGKLINEERERGEKEVGSSSSCAW